MLSARLLTVATRTTSSSSSSSFSLLFRPSSSVKIPTNFQCSNKLFVNDGGKGATRRLLSNTSGESSSTTAAAASSSAIKETAKVTSETISKTSSSSGAGAGGTNGEKSKGWWSSAEFWGAAGAIAGWGMSGAAIYDATLQGPEIISLNMTGVLIVYSSLFARWAYIVKPQNLLLASCHVTNVVAQCNQMRRALQYKLSLGQEEEVKDITTKAALTLGGGVLCVAMGPTVQSIIVKANLGILSTIAAADAGPFTVHFWAPMSKWLISGASFLDLHRPTDKISIAQYTALTLTGMFFSRYALLVTPINYTLCSVNIALFGSSAWHLGRKIYADYILGEPIPSPKDEEEEENKIEQVKEGKTSVKA